MMQKQNIKRSIYILPNVFTAMNLFCGYYSMTASVQPSSKDNKDTRIDKRI
ncbi:MAG: hypothetical protein GY699_08455 [Desulfobacteraceae bacterium]|nr:hypothetical protein [Desulfobacteraceae bacterium]